jgi:diguanylate cyclase (GGDEF)-like protein
MGTVGAARTARTVLIVDDSRSIRAFIRQALEAEGMFDSYIEARDGLEGVEAARQTRVDLVLCDLDMPRLGGFGFLKAFLSAKAHRGVPVLMLTGSGDVATKVKGFALGASDCIVKPCDPAELCARVRNYLRLKTLQDELEAKNEELEAKNEELGALAITDGLTQVHNRRYFMGRAEEELHRAQRYGRAFSLLLIDVDHFKRVNDTFGHQVGDDVLVAVARRLGTSLRSTDVLARYGGEEFVVCLPETDIERARDAAERLRAAIDAEVVPALGRSVTVSIGGAALTPDALSIPSLLKLADDALYRAKAAGRNRVELAAPIAIAARASIGFTASLLPCPFSSTSASSSSLARVASERPP